MARNQMFWVPGGHFFGARKLSGFFNFQPPQHRPHVELREPGSELPNPGFPLFTGGRDSEGTGVWSLGSEVAGFGFPTPRSIYTYSRSPASAAVMLHCTENNIIPPAGGRKYKLGALGATGEPFANAFGNQRFVFVSFSFFCFHDDP